MRSHRVLCGGVAVLIVAGAAAPPAVADDPVLAGTYTMTYADQHTLNGVVTPIHGNVITGDFHPCGPGCATAGRLQFHLVNGRWENTEDEDYAVRCADNRTLRGPVTLWFDAVTLAGVRTGRADPGCDGPPTVDEHAFTLTRAAPPPP